MEEDPGDMTGETLLTIHFTFIRPPLLGPCGSKPAK